jgi:hypothetical protein
MRAFSSYELFLEEVFILYVRGRPSCSGAMVGSFLRPRNNSHARDMIKSGMRFLEWNSPDTVVDRCDMYLAADSPIKQALTTSLDRLRRMRRVRNAIAHRSDEARGEFVAAVRGELQALPLKVPEPGEFLLMGDPFSPPNYFLLTYLDVFRRVAQIASE